LKVQARDFTQKLVDDAHRGVDDPAVDVAQTEHARVQPLFRGREPCLVPAVQALERRHALAQHAVALL
jgi:hypothetical protein